MAAIKVAIMLIKLFRQQNETTNKKTLDGEWNHWEVPFSLDDGFCRGDNGKQEQLIMRNWNGVLLDPGRAGGSVLN